MGDVVREGTMVGRFLCLLGIHAWKWHCQPSDIYGAWAERWCRRCGCFQRKWVESWPIEYVDRS